MKYETTPEGIDLHIYEQHQTTLATLQKYLIVNRILTIDDLAVMTDGFLTNDHSEKVSEIAWNCLTFGQNEKAIISNVLEDDEPNSKIYNESHWSPKYKEDKETSILAMMERNEQTRAEAESAIDKWENEQQDTARRDFLFSKKEASV